jgi:hypothetical protein
MAFQTAVYQNLSQSQLSASGFGSTNDTIHFPTLDPNKTRLQEHDFEQKAWTQCILFDFIIYVCMLGVLCILGLIGNTLSFAVLWKESGQTTAALLLQCLAVIDNLQVVTAFLALAPFQIVLIWNFHGAVREVAMYLCLWLWPMAHIAHMAMVWMMALIATNRYIAVCHPLRALVWCTRKRICLQVTAMTGLVILYCIPRFFEYELDIFTDKWLSMNIYGILPTQLKVNKMYVLVYDNILYHTFVFLVPLMLVVILNACLCRELWQARKRRSQLLCSLSDSKEADAQSITCTMVVIITIFIVCNTPASVNAILDDFFGYDSGLCGTPYFYFFQISNLLVVSNSAVNFVVYCWCRKQFRAQLVQWCTCTKQEAQRNTPNNNHETAV